MMHYIEEELTKQFVQTWHARRQLLQSSCFIKPKVTKHWKDNM